MKKKQTNKNKIEHSVMCNVSSHVNELYDYVQSTKVDYVDTIERREKQTNLIFVNPK